MKIQRNAIRPLSNTIKLLDSEGAITEVVLADMEPCTLERFILGVKLPQNFVLGDDAESRSEVKRMAKSGMVFKIA